MTTRSPGWLTAATPKPRKAPAPSLGQDALKIDGKARPLPRATVESQARLAQHGSCVDHVEVEGLTTPVCIRRGDDVEAIVAEARELAAQAP